MSHATNQDRFPPLCDSLAESMGRVRVGGLFASLSGVGWRPLHACHAFHCRGRRYVIAPWRRYLLSRERRGFAQRCMLPTCHRGAQRNAAVVPARFSRSIASICPGRFNRDIGPMASCCPQSGGWPETGLAITRQARSTQSPPLDLTLWMAAAVRGDGLSGVSLSNSPVCLPHWG